MNTADPQIILKPIGWAHQFALKGDILGNVVSRDEIDTGRFTMKQGVLIRVRPNIQG